MRTTLTLDDDLAALLRQQAATLGVRARSPYRGRGDRLIERSEAPTVVHGQAEQVDVGELSRNDGPGVCAVEPRSSRVGWAASGAAGDAFRLVGSVFAQPVDQLVGDGFATLG